MKINLTYLFLDVGTAFIAYTFLNRTQVLFFLQKLYKLKLLTKTDIYFFFGLHGGLLSCRKNLAYLEPVSIWILRLIPAVLRIQIRDSGWVKKSRSGSEMNIPDHISENLETIFGLKILLNSLMRIRDPESF